MADGLVQSTITIKILIKSWYATAWHGLIKNMSSIKNILDWKNKLEMLSAACGHIQIQFIQRRSDITSGGAKGIT